MRGLNKIRQKIESHTKIKIARDFKWAGGLEQKPTKTPPSTFVHIATWSTSCKRLEWRFVSHVGCNNQKVPYNPCHLGFPKQGGIKVAT